MAMIIEHPEADEQGPVEAVALELLVVVVRLAVGGQLDLGPDGRAGVATGERHDHEEREADDHQRSRMTTPMVCWPEMPTFLAASGREEDVTGGGAPEVRSGQWQCGPSAS